MPDYARKGRFHKGSTTGLRAWGVAKLLAVKAPAAEAGGSKKAAKTQHLPSQIKLQRFYRPEDTGRDNAYQVWPVPLPQSTRSWMRMRLLFAPPGSDARREAASAGSGI